MKEKFMMKDILHLASIRTGKSSDEVKKLLDRIMKILVEKGNMTIHEEVDCAYSKEEVDFFVQLIIETNHDFFKSYLIKGKRSLISENNVERIYRLSKDFYTRLRQTYANSEDMGTIEILEYINLSLVHEVTSPVLTKHKLFEYILSEFGKIEDKKSTKIVFTEKTLDSYFNQVMNYLVDIKPKNKKDKNARSKLELTIHDIMFMKMLLMEMSYDNGYLRKLVEQKKYNLEVIDISYRSEALAFHDRVMKSIDYAFDEGIKIEIEEIINIISGKELFEALNRISENLDSILKGINEKKYIDKRQKNVEFEKFEKYLSEYRY